MHPFADTVRTGPRGILWLVLGGCLAGALLGAEPLRARADNLPPSPVAGALGAAAGSWFDLMHAAGLDRPYKALHAGMRDARTVRLAPE